MALQPGTLVLNGRYRIDELLGEGASAEVYLATQLKLRAPRALKILRRAAAGGDTARIDEYRRRFELEGELQERLGGNPGIVRVHDTDEHDGAPVLVMEYLPGKTLKTAIQALGGRGMPWQRCAEVLRDVAAGLEALHEKQYVHRDVKPSNVLFAANGRAKLGDLGVAQTDLTRTRTDGLLSEHPGTPGYASPEHSNGGAYLTPTADVYALGVMGFEMLVGRLPPPAMSGRAAPAIDGAAPAWLKGLIQRMLAWDYRERPHNGVAVAEEIARGLQGERERAAHKATRARDLREKIEEALKAGRLVEADTLVDDLLQLDSEDLSAQNLARRVNRALVEEKRRIVAEDALRKADAEVIKNAETEKRRAAGEAALLAEARRADRKREAGHRRISGGDAHERPLDTKVDRADEETRLGQSRSMSPTLTFPATTYTYAAPNSECFERAYEITGALGELLGECGANVAKPSFCGPMEPGRVPALQVWAFSKMTFTTTTKVMVTEAVATNPAWRASLAAQGEIVLAVEGGEIEFVTGSFGLSAIISGLTLDSSNQYFDSVTLTFICRRR